MQKNTVAIVANPVTINAQNPHRWMKSDVAELMFRDSQTIAAAGNANTNAPLAIMCSSNIVPPR
ncbi:hypothetical protein [Stieleria marina]|uniref:hypothetical protein n=1 Tax=Stieleria marina TaxID=1930275 RepID=UPI003AF332D3